MTEHVRLARHIKTGHGRGWATIPPVTSVHGQPNFDNGLASVYLSPRRISATIHLVKPPFGEVIVCMPNIPSGRMEPRPDATDPTCQRCIAARDKGYEAKHRRGN